MKHWGSALFPLSLLLVLTLLTFWLRYATEMAEPNRDGKSRHDPDYILSDIVLRKLDQNGQLKYTPRAADVRHYPDDDTTDLTRPNLVNQNRKDGNPPVTISADRGRLSNDNDQVDLTGNVRIHRAATGKDAEMAVTAPQLSTLPDEEKAYTRHPVLMTQGNSWIKGVGFRMDNRARTYLLEAQARASLESKQQARKKKP